MKKQILTIAAIAALGFGLVSCGSQNTESTTTTTDSTTMVAPADTAAMAPATTDSAAQGVMVGNAMMVPSKNIVENAANSQDHTTLVAAVKQADLAGTLSEAGPFTVFAPTNEAFSKVPKAAVDNLMKPENKSKLANVLKYHVIAGKALKAADLKDGDKLKTVEGEELMVSVKDGKVMINGANVTIADVVSSNGVTHVIDAVLMPKK